MGPTVGDPGRPSRVADAAARARARHGPAFGLTLRLNRLGCAVRGSWEKFMDSLRRGQWLVPREVTVRGAGKKSPAP
jgi:hypothetical protein